MTTFAPVFTPYPKTPRLFRDVVITEKIDGTNAAVGILEDGTVYAQSRNRLIYPEKSKDNAGFAAWVADNAMNLYLDLGYGLHFGEWWGSGIQRGYGLTGGEKRFSLFNVHRWGADNLVPFLTPNLLTVPVLDQSVVHDTDVVKAWLGVLKMSGSKAAPGFMRPEGIVIYHTASRQVYKALIENDEAPKGETR